MSLESQLMENDEKQSNNTCKDINFCKVNNFSKDNNVSKHESANYKIELPIKGLGQYTFSKNKPTIHLPPIDPHSNTPIYPFPQKPQP